MEAAELAVQLHNKCRRRHGVPPLKLDPVLCEKAQAYASSLAHGQLTNEPDSSIGRNIFQTRIQGSSRNRVAVDAVEVMREAVSMWYCHGDEYNWDDPLSSNQHARSFSQMIWLDSEFMGVGLVTRGVITVLVVLYTPVGNVMSDESFKLNVFKPNPDPN